MPQEDPSKTEQATPKRLKKARNEGNVGKSQEIGKAFVVLAGLFALTMYIKYLGGYMMGLFSWFFSESFIFEPSKQNVYELLLKCSVEIAKMILPIILFLAFVAYLSNRIMVGPLWTTKVFKPKFSKVLNPVAGLKRLMINVNTLVRLGKSILQAAVISIAPYIVLKTELPNILPLFYQDAHGFAAYILITGAKMVSYALIPMIVIAAADLWYQKWEFSENMKMTKDEIKDERKQAEGDPVIKQQQKQKMMQFMMQRMYQDVPKADVVITNPTHFAVALKYDASIAPAPIVVAKGVDHVAQKIKEIARENSVPIRENRPLARALYKSVEIGDTIPEELYQAVAAILAQLHQFKGPNVQMN